MVGRGAPYRDHAADAAAQVQGRTHVVVDGRLDDVGAGQVGQRAEQQQPNGRGDQQAVGTQVGQQTPRQPCVVGLAEDLVFLEVVGAHVSTSSSSLSNCRRYIEA